jgi:hypothetical protein
LGDSLPEQTRGISGFLVSGEMRGRAVFSRSQTDRKKRPFSERRRPEESS